MNCKGLHCGGCRSGSSGGAGVVALVVVVVLIATAGPAIAAGAEELLHILIVAAIVVLSVAVAAGVTAAAVWYRRRALRAPATRTALPVVVRELGPRAPAAIEAPRLRFSAADPESAADPATEYVLRELAEVRA